MAGVHTPDVLGQQLGQTDLKQPLSNDVQEVRHPLLWIIVGQSPQFVQIVVGMVQELLNSATWVGSINGTEIAYSIEFMWGLEHHSLPYLFFNIFQNANKHLRRFSVQTGARLLTQLLFPIFDLISQTNIFGCMGGSCSELQGDIIAEILELPHILAEGHQLGIEGHAHQLATLLLKLHHRLIVAKSKVKMGFKKY